MHLELHSRASLDLDPTSLCTRLREPTWVLSSRHARPRIKPPPLATAAAAAAAAPKLTHHQRKTQTRSLVPAMASSEASPAAAAASTEAPKAPAVTPSSFDAESLISDMRSVFRSGVTRDIKWRQQQLLRIAQMIQDREQDIYSAIYKDLKRSKLDAYAEVIPTMKGARDAARSVPKWARPSKVGTDLINMPASSEIVPEPLGVVLIISPWNFPFNLSVDSMVGAIAAGNAVVLKPSELSPHSTSLLTELIEEYLDPQAVRVVQGGPEVAQALLEHKWDKIFFTGGTEIGRKVAVAAAQHLTPVTLELGGKNPCYFDDTADLVVGCKRLVWGAFVNAGQVCLRPDYILVEEHMAGRLMEQIRKTMDEFYGSDPSKSDDIARIISERHTTRLAGLLSDPRVKERTVIGGTWDVSTRYVAPTVVRDVPWDTPLMQQETFGPILAVQTVKSLDHAISLINDRPKPLVVYTFSSDKQTMQRIFSETSSGGAVANDVIAQVLNPCLPFGGVGDSGMGSYHGKFSFDTFSHSKAVMRKVTFGDVPFRYPPGSGPGRTAMRALLAYDFISFILILLGFRK